MPQTQNKTYISTENPQKFQAVIIHEKEEKKSPLEQKKNIRIASSVCVLIQTLAFTAYIILVLNDPTYVNQWQSLPQYSNINKNYLMGTVIGCGIMLFGLLMNMIYCIIGTVFVIVGMVLVAVYSSDYNGGYDELSSQCLMVIAGGFLIVAYNLSTQYSPNVVLGPSILFILVQDIVFLVYIIKLFQNQNLDFFILIQCIVGASITGFGLLLNIAHLIGINKRISGIILYMGIYVLFQADLMIVYSQQKYDGTISKGIILLAGGILIIYENHPLPQSE